MMLICIGKRIFSNTVFSRRFYCILPQNSKMAKEPIVKEIKIPLENGYLAAKEWGPSMGNPLLALHGWQDNAGSFDTLIPLLSPNLHVIAVDQIGHGLSSHKPLGTPYFKLEFVYNVKLIADYFGWNKFDIMGHSMGGECAIVFASMFPDMINRVIGLDMLKPVTYSHENTATEIKRFMDLYSSSQRKLSNKNDPPVYSEGDAVKRMIDGIHADLTEYSAQILIKRGTKQIEDGKFIFSRDIRTKCIWDCGFNSLDVMTAVVSKINCNLLLIKARNSPYFSDGETLKNFLNIYRKNCENFELVEVEGNHFVHLNYPERVASIINSFLFKNGSNL